MAQGKLRFITTLHGTDITVVGSDRAYMRPTRFALEESDAVTAVSRFLAGETQLVFGVKRPIQVIPNFVDVDRFVPNPRGAWYLRDSPERWITHVSNFRPVKRVGDVVRVFAQIARALPARLQLVGEGPDLPHALAVAEDLGVRDRIDQLGNVEDVETLLAVSDLCLSASETESFGLSLLEAMSCGTPCASTRVGGITEVLGDTGVLAPLGDLDALASGAIALLSDPDRHGELGRRARARAEREFALGPVLERYLGLYADVVAAR
jgi:N-acetyl-alpha-D-glucosaminyl L-malate synthase BshA